MIKRFLLSVGVFAFVAFAIQMSDVDIFDSCVLFAIDFVIALLMFLFPLWD